jgi:lysyl-tRNA synthetase class 2
MVVGETFRQPADEPRWCLMQMPSNATARTAAPRRRSGASRLLGFGLRPPVLGVAVAVVGVIGVASALTPSFPRRLGVVEGIVDPAVVHLAAGTTALVGFVLLLLGRGIARRRRAAFVTALALLLLSAATHLVKGLDVEETAIALGVAVLLFRARDQFTVRTPPGRFRTVGLVAAGLFLVDLTVGTLVMVFEGTTRPRVPVKPVRAFLETLHLLGGAAGTVHLHGWGRLLPLLLVALGFATAAVVLIVALAPAAAAHDTEVATPVELHALTDRDDGDTLDPFARRSDKRHVYSADGRAAVAYRVVTGVGLASGDPVGAPDAFPDAVARFVELCDAQGWRPAFMGVRGDRLPLYAAAGLRGEYLGDEAIVSVDGFSLDGRAMRGVRQAVNRTRNHGITTEVWREGELDDELRAELTAIAERGRDGAPERGFSMALDGLLSGRDGACVVVVARDGDGSPFAFQRYVPCRRGAGLSLDAMRRDRVGPNGVNERLIVDTVAWAAEHGISEVSLNFAFCRALLDEDAEVTGPRRLQVWLLRRMNPWFQIESLLSFNAKFAPRWVPRYLAYRSLGDLPVVAAAAASAEGFLPFDRSPEARATRTRPRRPAVAA